MGMAGPMRKQLEFDFEEPLQTRRKSLGGRSPNAADLTASSGHDKCNFPAGGVLQNNEPVSGETTVCLASVPARQWKRARDRTMVFVICSCKRCIAALRSVDITKRHRSKKKHG